jgi:oligoendopeptidase F
MDGDLARGVRWDLGELYSGPDDPALAADVEQARKEAEELSRRYRGKIASGRLSPAELAEALATYERIVEIGSRPSFYASLLFAADTQSEAALALDQWARERWTEIREAILFFDLELQFQPEEAYERAVSDPRLSPWRHPLELARQRRRHTLSEAEERILARKDLTSRAAFVQLYDEVAGALCFEIELDGERKTLTDGEILALLRHPDRGLRRRALRVFLETWRRHEGVFTAVFNNVLLDHRLETELRSFPDPMAPRHLDNDVSAEVVENLLDAVERHYPLVQRYLRSKALLLGIPDPEVSDVYAPLSSETERIPFDRARDLLLEAFGRFDERFAGMVRRFFDERWIDAEVRPAKRAGAFCASHSPAGHPYLLASYTGTSRDVSTLAHEIGHGLHALLSAGQRLLAFEAPLVLAETASVFSEMLLVEHLLRSSPSPAARARILGEALDEIYGTVFRQAALTRFELAAHRARRLRRLASHELGEIWLEEQRRLFGDAIRLPQIYRYGWMYVSHFVHLPFYCYAYSFGNLLALVLLERYRAEGARFVPAFVSLLAKGGSESPAAALRGLGLDLEDPAFWDTGFRPIRRMVEELEEGVSGGALRDSPDSPRRTTPGGRESVN